MRQYLHYLILSATRMEIEPLLSISTILSEIVTLSGVRIIFARVDETDFEVVVTGPGVINTAHGVTVYLDRYIERREENCKHLLIIQTGIAGFFKGAGLTMGGVAVATSETYIHTGVDIGTPFYLSYPHAPLPFDLVPDSPMSRQGHFQFDTIMVRNACAIIQTALTERGYIQSPLCHVIPGNFITVSAITSTPESADTLFRAFNNPCMEAMEGAAAAHIAALYNIPFIEVRAGSNAVGVRDKKEWDIPLACQRASSAVEALLERGEELLAK